jgi:hypothetical protein
MPDRNFTEIVDSTCPDIAPAEPIVIRARDARQGEIGTRMLYVLCCGVAGALIANAIILVSFAESGALG